MSHKPLQGCNDDAHFHPVSWLSTFQGFQAQSFDQQSASTTSVSVCHGHTVSVHNDLRGMLFIGHLVMPAGGSNPRFVEGLLWMTLGWTLFMFEFLSFNSLLTTFMCSHGPYAISNSMVTLRNSRKTQRQSLLAGKSGVT